MDIETANREATERMMEARPLLWPGQGSRCDSRHEGQPPAPCRPADHLGPDVGADEGCVIGALIFEGKAKDDVEAQALVQAGQVDF